MRKIMLLLCMFMYTVIYCQETQFFSDAGHLSILLNGYGFRIALVPNLTDAIESWDNPDENNNSPLTVITSVRRGDVIAVFLIFATTEEEVNLTYNFRTLKPDGTFSENTELIIHNGIANRNRYMYSRQMPIIVYYSYDQVGTYQYYLEIYDSGAYLCRAILEFQVK